MKDGYLRDNYWEILNATIYILNNRSVGCYEILVHSGTNPEPTQTRTLVPEQGDHHA